MLRMPCALVVRPGDIVSKHHQLQAPIRILYKATGAGVTKTISDIVNTADAARTTSTLGIAGSIAASNLAYRKSKGDV